jgi:fucose permease
MMGMALFFAGGAEGGFTFWTASFIQIEYGTLPRAGGLGTAVFALGMAAGRLLTSRLASRLGLKRILILSISLALAGGIGFYFVSSLYVLYVLTLFLGFCMAPFWPSIQTWAVRRLGADATMVMVLLSCFGIVGFSLVNFIMGVIGDIWDLRISFLMVPAVLLILLVLMILEKRIHTADR